MYLARDILFSVVNRLGPSNFLKHTSMLEIKTFVMRLKAKNCSAVSCDLKMFSIETHYPPYVTPINSSNCVEKHNDLLWKKMVLSSVGPQVVQMICCKKIQYFNQPYLAHNTWYNSEILVQNQKRNKKPSRG